MSEKDQTTMEKLASDPKAIAAGEMIKKLGFNMYMGSVREQLVQKQGGVSSAEMDDAQAMAKIATAIKYHPETVPEEHKIAFVEAIMKNETMGKEVKEAMTKKEAYVNFYRGRIHDSQLIKRAEEIAAADVPEGQDIEPEHIEAIIQLLLEEEAGVDEEPTEEDLSEDSILEALNEDEDPILEGDPKEVIASKIAGLAQRNLEMGREKKANGIYNKYLADYAK